MTGIDMYNPEPLYQQLARVLRGSIDTGHIKPGDRLPSEAQLCDQYQVSRETVRSAIAVLREEGLLVSIPGRFTYRPH